MEAMASSLLDIPRLFPLVDHELELVEPELRYVDDLLAACQHPLTRKLMPAQARTTRDQLVTFVNHNPRGQTIGDPLRGVAPGYTFWMRVRPEVMEVHGEEMPEILMAGSISLRLGHSVNLDKYLGHIGYHVMPLLRGRHFAERASRLLLPIARAHGHRMLWITCNTDNAASKRTCERLGAMYVDMVAVPRDNALYSQGDRMKCRYRMDL
jgi:tagatose 1,6-diphosphate aldolase